MSKTKCCFGSVFLFIFSSVQLLSCIWLFATPWTAAHQTSLSITGSQSFLIFMSVELVMPSISFSVVSFSSYLQSCPASGSFPMGRLFISGGQRIGPSASASVLPMNLLVILPFYSTSQGPLNSSSLCLVQRTARDDTVITCRSEKASRWLF